MPTAAFELHNQNEICCLSCHRPLALPLVDQPQVRCSECGATVVNDNNLFDFMPNPDPLEEDCLPNGDDWAAIDALNEAARTKGWFNALNNHFHSNPSRMADFTDPVRVGWFFHCYDPQASDVCLVLGNGWNTPAFPLSAYFRTVYSVGSAPAMLRFQAIRAAQDGVNNLRVLHAPQHRIPLADQSVDLIVLDDAFALNNTGNGDSVSASHLTTLLAEARRVLKPNGYLYMGVENRFGAHRFFSITKAGLHPLLWMLPRRMVKAVTALFRKRSDRHKLTAPATLASAWGYQRLLRSAGLPHSDIYWAMPSINYPRMSGPLEGHTVRYMAEKIEHQGAGRLQRMLAHGASFLPNWLLGALIYLFSPQFLVVASQAPQKPSLQARILARTPSPTSFVRLTMGINAEVKTTFLLLNRENQIYKAIRVVAEPGSQGTQATFTCEETEGIRGRPLKPHNEDDVRTVARWLADYHQSTHSGMWTYPQLDDEIKMLVGSATALLDSPVQRRLLDEFADLYLKSMQIRALPITSEHGDYTIPNVLSEEQNTATQSRALRVIDWEFSREHGSPLMDVGSFMLSLLRQRQRNGQFEPTISPGSPLGWFVDEYIHRGPASIKGIPMHLAPGYYLLRVLDRIKQQAVNPAIKQLTLAQWIPLLHPTLTFCIEVGADHIAPDSTEPDRLPS